VLVKTLMASVALNNIACIFLFELSRAVLHSQLDHGRSLGLDVLGGAFMQLGWAAATGCLAAVAVFFVARLVQRAELLTTTGFIAILLCVGLANHFGYSSMLACLFLGLAQANVTHSRDQVADSFFTSFEPAILAAFFTLAGMELTLEHAAVAGLVAVAFFVTRGLGKLVASGIAMRLAGVTRKVRENLGLAMIPQAGVAVGLVLILEDDPLLAGAPDGMVELFVAAVLTAVVMNEIAGPILTRLALARSGESGHDRLRLMDFIHEENILTGLEAGSMPEAIRKLTPLMVQSHRLPVGIEEQLLGALLDRERDTSTCLGGGLAVPHAILPETETMIGVMGLSEAGLPFDTPDGRPVHCVLMLAFPPHEQNRHLQILAMLARTIGSDPAVQNQLFHARSPAHAYEVLHHEHAEDFNYFLDESEEAGSSG
jgi:mannitol/fructose-specific phosphotransferase system IIA component (Ntr-type)